LQRSFRDRIHKAMVCYTDGSKLQWPLRKFFEIPAFGALLACDPFHKCNDLGFIDGKHFISATPDDLAPIVEKAMQNKTWALEIISTAQNMVREKHSTTARVVQFTEAIETILEDKYRGATWEDGEFIIHNE